MAPKRATTNPKTPATRGTKQGVSKRGRGGKRGRGRGGKATAPSRAAAVADSLAQLEGEHAARVTALSAALTEGMGEALVALKEGRDALALSLASAEAEDGCEEEGEGAGKGVAGLLADLEGIWALTRRFVDGVMKRDKGVVFAEPEEGWEWVARWMPHVYDTEEVGYKRHALCSVVSMAWVRQHLGQGPLGPWKGALLPRFVCLED
ncbi:Hypothetical protein D9617_18g033620 [Elsinoe fawcettii]|nr:Hypothetical protein D9617_18g033620 [Elsinoe fawcettii]